jgi:uncharacterized protein YqgC (DUF456 family)
MDLSDTAGSVTLISGLLIALGVLGVLVPVLPGLVLCWLGVLLWAVLGHGGAARWAVLAAATVAAAAGTVVKYAWPGRRLTATGVPRSSLVAGGVLGVLGFFLVPVIGLVLGFVLGIFLAERLRLGPGRAWASTRQALGAVGLSMLVEFATALAIALLWLVGLLLS